MRDDVLREVFNGPLREPEVLARSDGELEELLLERGFELTPLEMKAVKQVHDQAKGLEGEQLEEFLRANAGLGEADQPHPLGPDLDET